MTALLLAASDADTSAQPTWSSSAGPRRVPPPCPSRPGAGRPLADHDGFDTPGPSRCGPAAYRGALHPTRKNPDATASDRRRRGPD